MSLHEDFWANLEAMASEQLDVILDELYEDDHPLGRHVSTWLLHHPEVQKPTDHEGWNLEDFQKPLAALLKDDFEKAIEAISELADCVDTDLAEWEEEDESSPDSDEAEA